MDFSAIKDLYIGSTPVQSAWLNGGKVWGRKPAVDEQSIRDAMILWYDLKKHGATNESMASTPELVNHAYDPDKANVIDWTQFSTRGDGVQQFSIEITSTTNYWVVNQAAYHRTNSIPSFYVEVANLPEGHTINYFYGDGSDERQTYVVSYNGIHKIPACKVSPNVTTATGWFIDPNNPTGQTVADLVGTTITQVNPTFNATCYNFAWSGMSGIGGYESRDFGGFKFHPLNNENSNIEGDYARKISNFEINIIGKIYNQGGIGYCATGSNKFRYKLFVSGIKETQQLFVSQYSENYYDSHELYNGENDITIDFTESARPDYTYVTFYTDNVSNDEYNITVKLLPLYPHALVSDGVDDYCLVEGLPLLNKEDGFTIITKRKWINVSVDYPFALCTNKSCVDESGAFLLEGKNAANEYVSSSFGGPGYNALSNEDVIYFTSNSYNGIPVSVGELPIGNNTLALFRFYFNLNTYYGTAAVHSILLFNRDLTPEEIEWVKTNLIETEQ